MRSFLDAKIMALTLREVLKSRAVKITHGDSLELIAKAFGYENWKILSAKIEAARPRVLEAGASQAAGKTFHCSFCGESQHSVRKLIAGPNVFICDGCVKLCGDILLEEDKNKSSG